MKKLSVFLVSALVVVMSLSACGAEKSVTKSGVLTSLERFSMSITSSDGTVYTYSVDSDTKFDGEDESLGDTVEVVSSGEFKDGAHADEIRIVKNGDEVTTDVESLSGKITDAVHASVTVETEDGESYTVFKDDNTAVHSDSGISIGDSVEIFYTGSLNDNSAVANSIFVISGSDDSSKSQQSSNSNNSNKENTASQDVIRYLTGECVDDTMHNVTIKYNGVNYNVVKDDNTEVVGNIGVGDTIRIFHKGSLEEGMHATKIALISAAGEKITGVVVDALNMSMTIQKEDGTQVHVIKDDNTVVSSSISNGETVEITYDSTSEDGSIIAKQITVK